ncbi:MAG: branched-chain amino acid ABC transporter permease [Acidobacteria bacterium]|nr:branched-chain amino acid ABC transporter permease [Acidobacteriota bacterium]
MNYFLHISVLLEIYILLALSANQKVGLSGLLTLAQAVFYGVGAYVTAIIITKLGFSYWLALPVALLTCVLAALVFSFIAGKVRDLYFSLATLAIQIIFFSVVYNWVSITNGPYGIAGISSPEILGFKINTPGSFALFGGVWVICVVLFYVWFLKTPLCRMIQATRDDQIAVLSLGKDPNYYKRVSIIISAVIAGVAGTLYATYATYIDPSSFTLDESILILSIVLIGGAGGIIGPISGALIYILLPEALKFMQMPDSVAANMRMIIFGLLLVLIVRFKPKGIFGKYLIQ